jgi:peptide/nickel transport system permease protein
MLGVSLGALSAVKRDSGIDYVARMFTFTGISIRIFVTGLVVIYLLVRLFNWFPPLGYAFLWEDSLDQPATDDLSRPGPGLL